MATSINGQRTINWTKPFLKNQPLDFNNMEPALETLNIVMQTMVGPPLRYRFNRSTFTIATTPGICDYVVTVPDFGYLETQSITDVNNKTHALAGGVAFPRPPSSSSSRPSAIAVQKDDNEGNLTIRTKEVPNGIYTIEGDYQRKAVKLQSLGQILSPIPDEFAFVFNLGFLTIAGMLVSDARVDWWEKKFIGRLLGLQDGLDAQAVNIFLGLWNTNMKSQLRAQGEVQTGTQGRAGS